MPDGEHWIVTLSPDCRAGDVAAALEAEGFTVTHVFDAIGSISGVASKETAERARALPEVEDVSPDEPVDLGPPESPVAW